jgi:RND family efflux transporter MFP subunit
VYAPFSGVITKRNVDPGALINAGAGAAGRELFDIARVDPLRVYTSVPQAYAPFIKVGASTTVTLQEFPGQRFSAKVARTAESIDPNTRTLLTEVDVPNRDGRLLPGSFGEVHFAVGSNVNKVTVPVNAMLFRSEGTRLAVVGPDNKVELRTISIGKDYGTTLEVLAGVSTQDQIVINPPDSLEDGQQVTLAPASPGQGQDQSAAQPPAVPQSTRQEENLPQQQQRNLERQPGQQKKSNKAKGSR